MTNLLGGYLTSFTRLEIVYPNHLEGLVYGMVNAEQNQVGLAVLWLYVAALDLLVWVFFAQARTHTQSSLDRFLIIHYHLLRLRAQVDRNCASCFVIKVSFIER
jgi:hypothetical protein